MNESPSEPVEYRVFYSEWVRNGLRRLIGRAKDLGIAPRILEALKILDKRLRVYPQFGQPLRDLNHIPATLWIGVVSPLVVRYLLDEERRRVLIGSPIQTLRVPGL